MPSLSPQILVFGEALVDRFADRLVPGGAPFNVARHLSAFGIDVLLLSRIGEDRLAASLRDEMARYRLDTLAVQVDGEQATGCVDVSEPAPGHHEFHIAPLSAYDFYDHQKLLQEPRLADFFRNHSPLSMFYYGTLALRHRNSRNACHRLLDTLQSQRFLDFNWRAGHLVREHAWEAFQRAALAKVNEQELVMLLNWQGLPSAGASELPPESGGSEAIARLLARTQLATLIVTYGAAGYAAFARNGQVIARGQGIPGVTLVDTVGAGDAFSAITLLGSLLGWPLSTSLQRANEFAASICGQRGAVPADLAFYTPWREQWQLPEQFAPCTTGQP